MKPKRRIDGVIHHGRGDLVALDDRLPILNSGAAQRVDPDAHARCADRFQIDDIGEVGDIGRDVVIGMNARRLAGALIGHAHDTIEFLDEEFVRGFLDPACHVDIRRAAVGRIVFEAAFVGRIVRGADHDPVREPRLTAQIVGQDRVRDHRRRRIAAVLVDHRFDAIRREHLDGGSESSFRQRVRVHAQEQRPVDAGVAAVKADGLGDGQDVRFVERGGKRRAAMPRGAECDALGGNRGVGYEREIGRHQAGNIDQQRRRDRLAGQAGLCVPTWQPHSGPRTSSTRCVAPSSARGISAFLLSGISAPSSMTETTPRQTLLGFFTAIS